MSEYITDLRANLEHECERLAVVHGGTDYQRGLVEGVEIPKYIWKKFNVIGRHTKFIAAHEPDERGRLSEKVYDIHGGETRQIQGIPLPIAAMIADRVELTEDDVITEANCATFRFHPSYGTLQVMETQTIKVGDKYEQGVPVIAGVPIFDMDIAGSVVPVQLSTECGLTVLEYQLPVVEPVTVTDPAFAEFEREFQQPGDDAKRAQELVYRMQEIFAGMIPPPVNT